MMNARRAIPLLALCALALVVAAPVHSQTGIIVSNADAMRQEGVSLNSNLRTVTGGVNPRIVLQSANTMRQERVAAPPSALQALLAQVPPRIVVQFANTLRQARLIAPPTDLRTLFGQVAARIILQSANTSRQMALTYPAAAIGDGASPQIRQVQAQSTATGIKITWTTDEFATSEVRYGTSPNYYPLSKADPLFEKQHEVILSALAPGATYYYLAISIDRSGNQTVGDEHQFRATSTVYLPALLRQR